jgi:uncharacterized NAD-dependent epimerase/dehydratase family protein
VNTRNLKIDEAKNWAKDTESELNIPVVMPLEEGVDRLVSLFAELISKNRS